MTTFRPVVGMLLHLVMQLAVASLWIMLASTEQLEAMLVALCACGACGTAHGCHDIAIVRHALGSSLRHVMIHRGDGTPLALVFSTC